MTKNKRQRRAKSAPPPPAALLLLHPSSLLEMESLLLNSRTGEPVKLDPSSFKAAWTLLDERGKALLAYSETGEWRSEYGPELVGLIWKAHALRFLDHGQDASIELLHKVERAGNSGRAAANSRNDKTRREPVGQQKVISDIAKQLGLSLESEGVAAEIVKEMAKRDPNCSTDEGAVNKIITSILKKHKGKDPGF